MIFFNVFVWKIYNVPCPYGMLVCPSLILDGYVTSLVSDFDWMDLFGSVHGKVNLKYGQNVIVFDR